MFKVGQRIISCIKAHPEIYRKGKYGISNVYTLTMLWTSLNIELVDFQNAFCKGEKIPLLDKLYIWWKLRKIRWCIRSVNYSDILLQHGGEKETIGVTRVLEEREHTVDSFCDVSGNEYWK